MKQFFSGFIELLVSIFGKSDSQNTKAESSAANTKPSQPTTSPDKIGPIHGIDVSHHNNDRGPIDFRKVKAAGYDFVYIKATEGTNYLDPYFYRNCEAAKAAGLLIGAYHFFRPGKDAVAQAKFFYDKIKHIDLDLVLDCDWEVHDQIDEAEQVKRLKLFLDYILNTVGQKCMIYTGKWFIDEVDMKDRKTPLPQWLASHPLWLSDYSPASVAIPAPWKSYTILQTSESGIVPGIVGKCDLNVFSGSLEQLKAIGSK
ncbi:MAG: glycoside hydrolase family 25 protein [Bdellovibrio sp.]|nr:glycoside hydrolase family 25 protein [Bdellovibrio sp.]